MLCACPLLSPLLQPGLSVRDQREFSRLSACSRMAAQYRGGEEAGILTEPRPGDASKRKVSARSLTRGHFLVRFRLHSRNQMRGGFSGGMLHY
jgi:hypothetical protein